MPPPNEHQASFPAGVAIFRNGNGCQLTQELTDLLINTRQNYDWPSGTGASVSQARIIALEAYVCGRMAVLDEHSAHQIIVSVSDWAGNNAISHANIVGATNPQKIAMRDAIVLLKNPVTAGQGLNVLSALPGISLVIASKIYRFCVPAVGAAVDRHSSYFFNSLSIVNHGFATAFRREWATGAHTRSRLATFNNAVYTHNHNEYFDAYLPILVCIANAMNSGNQHFVCAATGGARRWTPTDVEMAAYYWWACHGAP